MTIVVVAAGALIVGVFAGYIIRKFLVAKQLESVEKKAQELLNKAREKEKDIIIKAKEKSIQIIDEAKREEVDLKQKQLEKLEAIAQLSMDEAKDVLFKNTEERIKDELAARIRKLEADSSDEMERKA